MRILYGYVGLLEGISHDCLFVVHLFYCRGSENHQNPFFFAFIANVFLMWSFCLILMGSTSRYKHIQNSFMHTLILRV